MCEESLAELAWGGGAQLTTPLAQRTRWCLLSLLLTHTPVQRTRWCRQISQRTHTCEQRMYGVRKSTVRRNIGGVGLGAQLTLPLPFTPALPLSLTHTPSGSVPGGADRRDAQPLHAPPRVCRQVRSPSLSYTRSLSHTPALPLSHSLSLSHTHTRSPSLSTPPLASASLRPGPCPH